MPSDDYAIHSAGATGVLKLKGAKIDKTTKKKKKSKGKSKSKDKGKNNVVPSINSDLENNSSCGDKKDSHKDDAASSKELDYRDDQQHHQDQQDERPAPKTESERQYEEAKKRKLLKLAEMSGSRPELLKTHKERVEELNTYLSKLSEHHDMPKIGPG